MLKQFTFTPSASEAGLCAAVPAEESGVLKDARNILGSQPAEPRKVIFTWELFRHQSSKMFVNSVHSYKLSPEGTIVYFFFKSQFVSLC